MQKGFILPLVLGVGAVLVGIIGLAYALFFTQGDLLIRNKEQAQIENTDILESWKLFESEDRGFSIRYPDNLDLEQTRTGFFLQSGGSNIFWFRILDNQEKLEPVDFWAEKNPFWDHAGETLEMTGQEKLERAKQFAEGARRLNVGGKYLAYRMVVPDVLTRVEIFWFIDDRVFKFGYSPDDNSGGLPGPERDEIANKILSTFQLLK